MTIGIYKLEFEDSFYIGQSLNIEKRYSNHKYMMQKGIHPNNKIQAYYNKYKTLPTLIILDECNIHELNTKEEYYIIKFNATNLGLNILDKAIIKLYGEQHPSAKHTNKQIIEIFEDIVLNNLSLKNIAVKHKVSINLVSSIVYGYNHTWLAEMYPEKYNKMLNLTRKTNGKTAQDQGILYPLIKSPDGEIFEVTNLTEFARIHKIHASSLCQLLNGKRKSANKFKLA